MKKLPKAITEEEFVKLMKCVPKKDKEAKVAFYLSYHSGLRVSEVVKLKPEDIQKDHIKVWEAKGGRDRTVPRPKIWTQENHKVLPIKKSIRSLQRNFGIARDKAGLPSNYSFHSLRHGFAIRSVENGVPLNQVQALLGHSNISTTSVYTRARPMDALKSYKELW